MKSGIIAIVAGLTMIMASIVWADVPGSINYQGRLTDNAGVPLNNVPKNAADGWIDLSFRIFDAEAGGNQVWSQTTNDVPVNNGLFSVLLTGLNETVIPATAQVNRWLEVEVITNGVISSILAPRKELSSVPYALRAGSAQSIDGISVDTLTETFTSVTNVWNYASNLWLSVSNSVTNIQINVGLIQTNIGLLQTNIGLLQTNVGLLQTNVSIITNNISNLWCAIGYVVGKTGCEPYSNIQVAVNAAVAAGHGPARPVTVEVKPGRYTNDLVLQAGIHLKAEVEDGLFSVVVVGNHSYNYTGAEDGDLMISGIAFYSPGVTAANPLFRVSGSGYTSLRLNDCVLQSTDNGPALRLENTGVKDGRPSNTEMFHSRVRGLNAASTAAALIELNSGSLLMDEADIYLADAADRSFRATGSSALILDNAQIRGRIETANQAYLQLTQSAIDSSNQACLAHNSISNALAFEVYLNSSAGQVVTGVGPFIYNNLGLNSPTQTLATAFGVYPVYTEGASNLIYRAGRPGDWTSLFTTVPTNVSRALDLLARGVTNIQTNIVLIQTNFPFREHDPQVDDFMGQFTVPRWRGTNLTGGSITNLDNGNVGIGTPSPIRTLDVNGNAIIRGSLDMNGDVVTNVNRIQVLSNRGAGRVLTSDGDGFGTWQAPAVPIFEEHDPQVYDYMDQNVVSRWRGTNLTDSVIFSLDNGNVGIGTDNPGTRLAVAGNLNMMGNYISNVQQIQVLDGRAEGKVLASDAYGYGRWTNIAAIFVEHDPQVDDNMSNYPNAVSRWWGTNLTTGSIYNLNNGDVGMGTTNPQGRLDVRSPSDYYLLALAVGTASNTYLRAGDTNNGVVIIGDQQTERTVIQPSGGNVGLGTYSPNRLLHLKGSAPILKFEDDEGQKWWFHGKASGNSGEFGLYDETTNAYRLYVRTGNVGIGTTLPDAKLDVNGASIFRGTLTINSRNSQLRLSGGNIDGGLWTDGNMLRLDNWLTARDALAVNLANGNVAIGTIADPGARLGVAGNLNMMGNNVSNVNQIQVLSGRAANRVLTSDANGYGSWQDASISQERDPQVDDGLANNAVPRWDGLKLVTGSISDPGTGTIELRGYSPTLGFRRNETSGGFIGGQFFVNYGGGAAFWAGASGNNTAYDLYSIRAGDHNGALGLSVAANGNVGVGTPAPAVKLDVNGQVAIRDVLHIGKGVSVSDFRIITDRPDHNYHPPLNPGGHYQFLALRAYEDFLPPGQDRTVLVPAFAGFRITDHDNSQINFEFMDNGQLWIRTSPVLYSDSRIKLDQRELDYGLEKVMALKPKRYNMAEWEQDMKTGKIIIHPEKKKNDIGFVAQDMQEIIPEAVVSSNLGDEEQLLGIAYPKLLPVLIKAIQDQQKLIQKLEDKVEKLDDEIKRLEKRVGDKN